MATYKVLQDIEAEDKLLGPLSLRQFIYAVIVVVLGFLGFTLAKVQPLLVLPLLPPFIFFGLLAAPFGREQSSEVWLLAKIRYVVFPRRRLWDQSGQHDLVTINVPKVIQKHLTKDFDRDEAKSRLKALASTMDTRGWAIKNVNSNIYADPLQQSGGGQRLLELHNIPTDDLTSVKASEDVLDATDTPLAQQIKSMVAENEQAHRQAMLTNMHNLAQAQKTQPNPVPVANAQQPAKPVIPASQIAQPLAVATQPIQQAQAKPMTQAPTPAIIPASNMTSAEPSELHLRNTDDASDGEVVISLH